MLRAVIAMTTAMTTAIAFNVPGFAHEGRQSAAETDPAIMGWMTGHPVPADKQVRWDDGSMWRFPQLRWTFSRFRDLVPTAAIPRGPVPAELPRAPRAGIDAIAFTAPDGTRMTIAQMLAATYSDAILVMHGGRVVHEAYYGITRPDTQHILFSVTKSFVGTLAETLIDEGRLDPAARADAYVPELKGSGLGDATIRQILDMRTGLAFSEDYVAGQSGLTDVQRMSIAGAWAPRPPGHDGPDGSHAFVASLGKNAPHGGDFVYRTPNTQALQWIIERVTGQSLAEQIRDRYWQRLGMEQDAAIGVDRIGTAFGGGGLMASLRDIARFGEMLRQGGRHNGQQIVPPAAVERIFKGGDPAAFAAVKYPGNLDGNYGSQWWHRAGGQTMALGVHGQGIYIDRKAGIVIARLGSHPVASNRAQLPLVMAGYDAIVATLGPER
jgi:CubicO group peptidase (beta-lactamase class C family)